MRFRVVQRIAQAPRDATADVILERGSAWNDSGYATLFDVIYRPPAHAESIHVGSAKILQRGAQRTELEAEFEALPETFCTLGQTEDFYDTLHGLGDVGSQILSALRDVVQDSRRALLDDEGFNKSLLRFSEPRLLFQRRVAPGGLNEAPNFTFRCDLHALHFAKPHVIQFTFSPKPEDLGRLVAIIGASGVGKTTVLATLARILWGIEEADANNTFEGGERPLLGRVIAVNYGALDVFRRPPERVRGLSNRPAFDSYVYAGSREPMRVSRASVEREPVRFSLDQLFVRFEDDVRALRRLERIERCATMLERPPLTVNVAPILDAWRRNDDAASVRALGRLSAGHKLVVSVLTRVLARVRSRAIILFDEPELHLHPRLLAFLLRELQALLSDFDAYGIVATHSPLVLQQVPSKQIRLLRVNDGVPSVLPYPGESFGESISTLLERAYGVEEVDQNYVTALRQMRGDKRSVDEIEDRFPELSLNARMALRSLADSEDDV